MARTREVRTRGRAPTGARRIHLHLENHGALGETFHLSPKRVKEALARHPKVARRLRVTIGYDGDVLERELRTADALLGWRFDRRNLAERAPRLKWIHAHGAGVNHLMPLDWLPKGVVLTNSRGVHGPKAEEYTAMALLMLNNRVPESTWHQRHRRWQRVFNSGIAGKTALIIGVGHVGGGAAKWANRFGLRVLGVRRTGRPQRYVDRMYRPRDIPRLVPKADFIIMCAPETADSRHLLGRREIRLMKTGAGLVNYSRAGLVDYDALRERLKRGEVSAVLDVFKPEPLPSSSPLWNTPNLVITPHCSSDDTERYVPRTLDLVMRNMVRFMAGRPLANRVSATYQY